MSVKIYNAFRAPHINTIEELFQFTTQLREEINKVRLQLDADTLVEKAIDIIDSEIYQGKSDDTTSYINQAYSKYVAEQKEEIEGTVFHDPHSFEASIGFDNKRQEVLLLGHFRNKEYKEVLEQMGLVDWHYQSQVDKPDNVSQEEWGERKESWNRVMPNFLPSETMLSFDTMSPIDSSILLSNIADFYEGEDSEIFAAVERALEKGNHHETRGVDIASRILWDNLQNEISQQEYIDNVVLRVDGGRKIRKIASKLSELLPKIYTATLNENSIDYAIYLESLDALVKEIAGDILNGINDEKV